MLIAFNKPFGVLSQFTGDGSANRALAEFNFPKNVYPIGRLDADSEGLAAFERRTGSGTKSCCIRVTRTSASIGRRLKKSRRRKV
jgi:23S rRNA pseudouridine2457 synthase